MRYICIMCGAAGASAHKDPHPPLDYNCHICPDKVGKGSMWPEAHAELFRSTFAAYNRSNARAYNRPLTVYLIDGTTMQVPYNVELMSFEHGGMAIRNPFISECGRFSAEPEYYGFSGWSAGGGCVALRKDFGSRYWLLTDASGMELPDATSDDLLALYSKNGEPLAIIRIKDIPFSE